MPCLLTTGYTLPCKGVAGIKEVYIGNYNGTMGYTYGTMSGTNLNQITAFTGATTSFYTFQQPIETGSLTNTGNYNDQNGTAYYDQALEITIHNVTQTILDQVTTLGQGRWRVIVLDQNGNYFLMGLKNPVSVTAAAGGHGKSYADVLGYTLTFTGKEATPLTQVTTAAALSVIA